MATAHDEFTAFVERQSRFVFRVAYAVLRNAHDAEDVAQDTFLKVYRANAWSRMDDERAFLARTAWRLAVDRLPRRIHAELDDRAPSKAAGPEQATLENDWNATVHRLIDALPEELRQPIALSTVDDLTSREIAVAMGIPEGTVRTRLMRARQILKEKLTALMEARHAR